MALNYQSLYDGENSPESQFKKEKIRLKLFAKGFVYATLVTGILYYLIKFIAS